MSTLYGNSFAAANLFYNGGFALVDGELPTVWEWENLNLGGLNSASFTGGQLELVLGSRTRSSIYQDLLEKTVPLDFSTPLQPGISQGMAAGYRVEGARALPRNIDYTVSFDIHRKVGEITFKVFFVRNSERIYADLEEKVILSNQKRLHFSFKDEEYPITRVGIEFQADISSVFTLDKVMLAAGSYAELPYTGDPFIQVFPKDCIVMSLGDSCPPGFKELGEGDLQPLSDWIKSEPSIKARKGNFPRSGDELTGSPEHTIENPQVQDGLLDKVEFEGYEGNLYDAYATTPDNNETNNGAGPNPKVFSAQSRNPDVDDFVSHTHDVNPAGSRPVSISLNFCKRL